jgi:hypothetical protein
MYLPPSNFINYLCASVSALFGLVYLFKPTFMGYHKAALEKNWEDLDEKLQTLILALMRAVSGGALLLAFIILVLQDEYDQKPQHWIPGTILAATGIYSGCSLYAMLLVSTKTKAKPPVIVVLISLTLAVLSYFIYLQER